MVIPFLLVVYWVLFAFGMVGLINFWGLRRGKASELLIFLYKEILKQNSKVISTKPSLIAKLLPVEMYVGINKFLRFFSAIRYPPHIFERF